MTALSLLGKVNLNLLGMLHDWAKHTDFSHLTLGGGYGCEDMGMNDEAIEWIVENCSFPQLKTLHTRLDRHDHRADNPNYVINAIALLSSFGPLE